MASWSLSLRDAVRSSGFFGVYPLATPAESPNGPRGSVHRNLNPGAPTACRLSIAVESLAPSFLTGPCRLQRCMAAQVRQPRLPRSPRGSVGPRPGPRLASSGPSPNAFRVSCPIFPGGPLSAPRCTATQVRQHRIPRSPRSSHGPRPSPRLTSSGPSPDAFRVSCPIFPFHMRVHACHCGSALRTKPPVLASPRASPIHQSYRAPTFSARSFLRCRSIGTILPRTLRLTRPRRMLARGPDSPGPPRFSFLSASLHPVPATSDPRISSLSGRVTSVATRCPSALPAPACFRVLFALVCARATAQNLALAATSSVKCHYSGHRLGRPRSSAAVTLSHSNFYIFRCCRPHSPPSTGTAAAPESWFEVPGQRDPPATLHLKHPLGSLLVFTHFEGTLSGCSMQSTWLTYTHHWPLHPLPL